MIAQGPSGYLVGCPSCGVHEPLDCTCSQLERLLARIKVVQRENRALREELAAYAAGAAMPPPPAHEAGHEL